MSKASDAGSYLASLSNVHITDKQRKARSKNLKRAREVRSQKAAEKKLKIVLDNSTRID